MSKSALLSTTDPPYVSRKPRFKSIELHNPLPPSIKALRYKRQRFALPFQGSLEERYRGTTAMDDHFTGTTVQCKLSITP